MHLNVMKELDEVGAVYKDGHFVYGGGKHGPNFLRFDALLAKPQLLNAIGGQLVSQFPGMGITRLTSNQTELCMALAEAGAENLGVITGYEEDLEEQLTLVVNDDVISGAAVRVVVEEARSHGARVAGASVIVDQGNVTAGQCDVPYLTSLASAYREAYDPVDCELCLYEIPIVGNVARGSEFKLSHPDYVGGFVELDVS